MDYLLIVGGLVAVTVAGWALWQAIHRYQVKMERERKRELQRQRRAKAAAKKSFKVRLPLSVVMMQEFTR